MNKLNRIKEVGLIKALRIAFFKYLNIDVLKLHYLVLDTNIDDINKQLRDFNLDVKELNLSDFYMGNPDNFTPTKMEIVKKESSQMIIKAGESLKMGYWSIRLGFHWAISGYHTVRRKFN